MKRKILFAVMIIAISIIAFGTISVLAATPGDLSYSVSNREVTITGCAFSASGKLEIPDKLGGYRVTSIGNRAFYNCTSLTSITIPNSVKNIDAMAFWNCTNLESITIPYSVTSIGNRAFENCSSLVNITIPSSVTSIGNWPFSCCSSLKSISVDENNKNYCSVDGNLFDKNKTKLIQYAIGKTDKEYVIPNSVTSIDSEAFESCTSLTSITIPNSVTSIGYSAFEGCSSLESVTIPNNVTSIGYSAFEGCSSLVNITIPSSVTSIGIWAFGSCSSLNKVNITDMEAWCNIDFGSHDSNPLYYGGELYLNGNLVTDLVIPDSVTSIADYVFYKCTSITSITIPDSVTSIGYNAFCNCSNVENLTISDSVTYIGERAFYGCTSLTSVTIPDGVTSISDGAFYCCTSLTSVIIPNTVTNIGNMAFRDCSNLKDAYYTGTESEWNAISIGSFNTRLTNAKIHFIQYTKTNRSNNDKSFTITPIGVENGKAVILALYDGEKFVEMQSAVYNGEAISFTTTKTYTKAKVFVWNDLTTLSPVCEVEIVK